MWPNGELKLDGKLQQMEIFQDPCTINALSINTIEMDKLPASYTAVGHPVTFTVSSLVSWSEQFNVLTVLFPDYPTSDYYSYRAKNAIALVS